MRTTSDESAIEQTPEFWWIVLLRTMRESDLVGAAEAQERLRQLGIGVQFTRLLPDGEAVPHA